MSAPRRRWTASAHRLDTDHHNPPEDRRPQKPSVVSSTARSSRLPCTQLPKRATGKPSTRSNAPRSCLQRGTRRKGCQTVDIEPSWHGLRKAKEILAANSAQALRRSACRGHDTSVARHDRVVRAAIMSAKPNLEHARMSQQFASDNNAGICPEALEALCAPRRGACTGITATDEWTAKACARLRDVSRRLRGLLRIQRHGRIARPGQLCKPYHR